MVPSTPRVEEFPLVSRRSVPSAPHVLWRPWLALLATTLASFGWLIFTMWGGALSDRLGRVRTFQIGYGILILWAVPMLFLLNPASLPLFALFLNIPIVKYLPGLILIFALGTIGFASIGTLFAAMAVHSRMREVMLPIPLFPLASPILIAAVETTGIVFRDGGWDELSSWINLLATFMVVFLAASLLLFDYILEE